MRARHGIFLVLFFLFSSGLVAAPPVSGDGSSSTTSSNDQQVDIDQLRQRINELEQQIVQGEATESTKKELRTLRGKLDGAQNTTDLNQKLSDVVQLFESKTGESINQLSGSSSTSSSDSPGSSTTTSNSQDEETSVIAVDSNTKIIETTWTNSGVTIIFESSFPRMVSLVDSNSIEKTGASTVNYRQVRLSSGRTEVTMDLENDAGDMTVIASLGENVVALSNPTKPLLESITRTDFYIEGAMVAIFGPLQVLFRLKWFRYRLKSGLTRVA